MNDLNILAYITYGTNSSPFVQQHIIAFTITLYLCEIGESFVTRSICHGHERHTRITFSEYILSTFDLSENSEPRKVKYSFSLKS